MPSSLKRRRPWATTLLLLTSVEAIEIISRQVETNVTPTPTVFRKTASPSQSPLLIRKENFPVAFDLELNFTDTVDMSDLLMDVDLVLEDYLFSELSKLEVDDSLNVRDVSLDVRLRRRLRSSVSVPLGVDGSVRYDMDSAGDITGVNQNIQSNLEALLLPENLEDALVDAEVESFVGVISASLESSPEEDMVTQTPVQGLKQTQNDELERPSTLSIIFGFILTGIAALGLVFYAYIFCRKRRKRQKRKKQMKESFQYRMPNKRTSPPKPPISSGPTTSTKAKDDSSEDSSYQGMDSESEGPADSFARELEMAASLDQQAWESFQDKKTRPRPQVVAAPVSDYSEARAARSFPYGDEAPGQWDQPRSEEKKDEWSPQEPPAISASSAAAIHSIEQTLEQYGTNYESDQDEDPSFAETLMEVARLSKFVKRYEKRKQRRAQRELSSKSMEKSFSPDSHDPVGTRGSMVERSPNAENISINLPQQPVRPQSHRIDLAGRISAYDEKANNQKYLNVETFNDDLASISDDEFTFDTDTQGGSLVSGQGQRRLGISPFNAQADEDNQDYSFNYEVMSPMMQKLAKGKASRPRQEEEDYSHPTDEQHTRHAPQPQGQQQAPTLAQLRGLNPGNALHDLRDNNAIIDSSQSDVTLSEIGVPMPTPPSLLGGGVPDPRLVRNPSTRTPTTPKTRKTPKYAGSPNPRFNKLRNLFEDKPDNAIFPPDANWQYGAK